MEVRLSNGMVAVIDRKDAGIVLAHEWRAFKSRVGWYACATIDGQTVFMHRLITGAPRGSPVDHRDSDGLNNRRKNLRLCTHAQNMQNRKLRSDSTSGVKNVMWREDRQRWIVSIKANGKRHRKLFVEFDAACLYAEEKRRELHGEFAYEASRDSRLQSLA